MKKKLLLNYVYLGKLLLQRNKNTAKRVSNVYNDGNWKKKIDDKIWEKCSNINDYYFMGGDSNKTKDSEILCIVNDEFQLMNFHKLGKLVSEELITEMKQFSEEDIIELGCGTGRNVFLLKQAEIGKSLVGVDISANSIETARRFNSKLNLGLNFDTIDMIKDDLNFIENKTIFTYFSLEQIKYDLYGVIKKIVMKQPKQVISFESIPKSISEKIYHYVSDYQTKLFSILKSLEKNNLLVILDVQKMSIQPNPFRMIYKIHWKPKIKLSSHEKL